ESRSQLGAASLIGGQLLPGFPNHTATLLSWETEPRSRAVAPAVKCVDSAGPYTAIAPALYSKIRRSSRWDGAKEPVAPKLAPRGIASSAPPRASLSPSLGPPHLNLPARNEDRDGHRHARP